MRQFEVTSAWRRSSLNLVIGLIAGISLLGGAVDVATPGGNQGKPDKVLQPSFQVQCKELTCDFDDATRSDDHVVGWEWDFGDATSAQGRRVAHRFAAGGTFYVTLTVTDTASVTASTTKRIKVKASTPTPQNVAPDASFVAGCDWLVCTLEDRSTDDGSLTAWVWEFGDGSTSGQQHPSHVYATGGSYTVSLTVTDDTGTTDVATDTVTVKASTPTPAPAPSGGLPFGVFFPPDDSWGSEFTGGFVTVTPSNVVRELDMVRAVGGSVVINLAGKKETHQNPDETFNLEMWKAAIDKFAGIDLSSYVADGTILAHYMTDEPKSRGSWGAEIIHNAVLDEMARYSKSLWPTMPTTLRVSPSKLARHAGGYDVPLPGWEWQYFDIGWAQYSARFGSVTDYTALEIAEANRQGLGLVFGLNVIDGGDGSSGLPGVRSGKWAMSAQELRDYAGTLIRSDGACTFLMWRYDWNGYVYYERPDIRAAVSELAALAASRDAPRCSVR